MFESNTALLGSQTSSAYAARAIGSAESKPSEPNERECGPTGPYGVPENRQDVNDNYIITITSTYLSRVIRAHMQGNFTMRTRSTWQRPAMAGGFSEITDAIQAGLQGTIGAVAGNTFLTRRVWKGTTPCIFTVLLKFEAINDPINEVLIPCETLHQMSVPGSDYQANKSGPAKSLWKSLSLYPPGPNPFIIDGVTNALEGAGLSDKALVYLREQGNFLKGKEDRISISIGKFLMFDPVIVSEASVTFGRRFSESGHPMSAEVSLIFESFETYTKEVLHDKVYGHGRSVKYSTFKYKEVGRLYNPPR